MSEHQCAFRVSTYFEDLDVVETVTRRRLTVNEVIEILDCLPNVKTVRLRCDPPRAFSLKSLAFPQYASRYQLTKSEWEELQAYCKEKLKDPIAIDEVIEHWKSIAEGTPPFGLQVAE